ncbi:MAG: efflux RND transporter permease subunit [Pseudomonadota bacterium]
MTGMVDWATQRARMIVAFVILSIGAGTLAYVGLPKEGEPDIDVPALFVRVAYSGISAADSDKLLVRPLENELRDVDGLDKMTATAGEGFAVIVMEFEFGWDKAATIADVRARVDQAKADFPDGFEEPTIDEINFSEFPILVISLSGEVPERTLLRLTKDMQDVVQSLPQVLEAGLAGHRDEMLEVIVDPLKLQTYNITADELIEIVTRNNQLIAAGEMESGTGSYALKIPSSFDEPADVFNLPIKVNGDRVVTVGDLAEIRLTFEDAIGTARFDGEPTIALQVVKRKGENLIQTVAAVKAEAEALRASWPQELQDAINLDYSMDDSTRVQGMVDQLEASVFTAVALVMIVVLASLGFRSALLVGFAIPTSFLLSFALMAVFGMTISNIVMFGLILAVGMLVDGAIVVVEYADKRISEGEGPMRAFASAAKRMFWPIVSSTATTLCAFLPMLFWPGMPGEFMGNLPVTLIFVLSASLVVALLYLPVMGGVSGRVSRALGRMSDWSRRRLPWLIRAVLLLCFAVLTVGALFGLVSGNAPAAPTGLAFLLCAFMTSVFGSALAQPRPIEPIRAGYRRSLFGRFIHLVAGNPIMPFVTIAAAIFAMVSTFQYFGANNNGVEFFVKTEPERAVAYVRGRGNLSLDEADRLVKIVEDKILGVEGVDAVFAFAGSGGLNQNRNGAGTPLDEIGQVQIELAPWGTRRPGDTILAEIQALVDQVPGIFVEVREQARGPAQGKPLHVRLTSDEWPDLKRASATVFSVMQNTPGLIEVDDTMPLPGIDWEITVDVEQAGRYGADVSIVGAMVQLVTRGVLLGSMRLDTSDEEVEIRVRFPEDERLFSTLDGLKVRTSYGLVPLASFIERTPVPKLGEINRFDTKRYVDIRADVEDGLVKIVDGVGPLAILRREDPATVSPGDGKMLLEDAAFSLVAVLRDSSVDTVYETLRAGSVQFVPVNANERIEAVSAALDAAPLPPTVSWEWTGDREEQEESQAFLGQAFLGALGLMFVILLAQFNSIYNSILVLSAVVMSITGVLIGMLVLGQTFSIIMTGTGIVALAGIVVNNNIVLIDTYQEYRKQMPPIEAITRTAEARIRPVLLTTITTIAGLTPMMLGVSVDFIGRGWSIDAPTALWWKQLATAVVWGLGVATVLTLVVTPAALAARVWVTAGARRVAQASTASGRLRLSLQRQARKAPAEELIFDDTLRLENPIRPLRRLDAAE